jgi:hypothetical protein
MPRVYLYNTSIITAYGSYRYEPLSLHEARTIALTNSAESAIGHQATADILTELFGKVQGTIAKSSTSRSPR